MGRPNVPGPCWHLSNPILGSMIPLFAGEDPTKPKSCTKIAPKKRKYNASSNCPLVLELPGPTVSRTNDAIRRDLSLSYTLYCLGIPSPYNPMQKTSSVRYNAAPTPFNPSIVLSEESEIQSPRFPVFLVVILPFSRSSKLFWKTI